MFYVVYLWYIMFFYIKKFFKLAMKIFGLIN